MITSLRKSYPSRGMNPLVSNLQPTGDDADMVLVVDFGVIAKSELQQNYSIRGGQMEVSSQDRAVQEEREQSKLLVIYTSLSDIPPSPREPPEPLSDEPSVLSAEKEFGAPKADSFTKVTYFRTWYCSLSR